MRKHKWPRWAAQWFTLTLQSAFQMNVVKPKPKELSQPITTNTNYPMNQSELETNTRNLRQARENVCEQVTTVWILLLIGQESGARFFHQSQGEVKQNQSKTRITFDTIENRFKPQYQQPYSPHCSPHISYDNTCRVPTLSQLLWALVSHCLHQVHQCYMESHRLLCTLVCKIVN